MVGFAQISRRPRFSLERAADVSFNTIVNTFQEDATYSGRRVWSMLCISAVPWLCPGDYHTSDSASVSASCAVATCWACSQVVQHRLSTYVLNSSCRALIHR